MLFTSHFVKRMNSVKNSSDNKMTIQSPQNPYTRYNPDKTPGFLPPKSTHYNTEQLYKEEWE